MSTNYNEQWRQAFAMFFSSKVFRHLLPGMLVVSAYTALLVYLHHELGEVIKVTSFIYSLVGIVLGLLLVFRTNTAYDRWWEGRKLWGHLVNNSRNLALKLQVFLPGDQTEARTFFKQAIPFYAHALHKHLLKEKISWEGKEILHPALSNWEASRHIPNRIAEAIIGKVHDLNRQQLITDSQLIILNEELRSFTDVCGACERIKNTPIPYSYTAFIKKFIFIYVITMPIGFAFNLGYFTIPVTTFIFYVLASLELIAEEIEDPFGKDSNDLPMQTMAANIKSNVEDILTDEKRTEVYTGQALTQSLATS